MANLPARSENLLPTDVVRSQIEQTLQRIRPTLVEEDKDHSGRVFPAGYQLCVQGPDVSISSPAEYKKVTGMELGGFGEGLLGLGGEMYAPQHLGYLNVIGATTGPLNLDFRRNARTRETGGKDFEIIYDGTTLTINGDATLEEVNNALNLLFTKDGKINKDTSAIHSLTRRNLKFFDKDGNSLPRKESLPANRAPNHGLPEGQNNK